jgi:hypothetical protein
MKFAQKCLLAATVLAAVSTAALAAPSQLTDVEMAKVVAGKKDQSTPGNGNDTNNDGSSNLVYEYINGSKIKYLDFDSGGGSTNTWSCNTYGTITNGVYVAINSCGVF